MPPPEQIARESIDTLLTASGWVIQDFKDVDLSANRGIALREDPLRSGRRHHSALIHQDCIGTAWKRSGDPAPKVLDEPSENLHA